VIAEMRDRPVRGAPFMINGGMIEGGVRAEMMDKDPVIKNKRMVGKGLLRF